MEGDVLRDALNEIAKIIRSLMKDDNLAKTISENGRKKAIEIYGRDNLAKQWAEFFKKIGVM